MSAILPRPVRSWIFSFQQCSKSTLMYTLAGIMLDIKKKEEVRGGERKTLFFSHLKGRTYPISQPHTRDEKQASCCVRNDGGYSRRAASWKNLK